MQSTGLLWGFVNRAPSFVFSMQREWRGFGGVMACTYEATTDNCADSCPPVTSMFEDGFGSLPFGRNCPCYQWISTLVPISTNAKMTAASAGAVATQPEVVPHPPSSTL